MTSHPATGPRTRSFATMLPFAIQLSTRYRNGTGSLVGSNFYCIELVHSAAPTVGAAPSGSTAKIAVIHERRIQFGRKFLHGADRQIAGAALQGMSQQLDRITIIFCLPAAQALCIAGMMDRVAANADARVGKG